MEAGIGHLGARRCQVVHGLRGHKHYILLAHMRICCPSFLYSPENLIKKYYF